MAYKLIQVKIDTHLVRGDSVRYWNGVWTKDRFIIVDDKSATDEVIKQTWRIVTPIETKLSVLTLEKARNFLLDPEHYGNERIVLFSPNINNIARLAEAGIEFGCPINVCSLDANGEKKLRVGKTGLSQQDVDDLHMLHEKGCRIVAHEFPDPVQQEEDFYQKLLDAENKKA